MSRLPPPSAEAQLAFPAKLQQLLAEGDFTATYKFALPVALAVPAVEIGHRRWRAAGAVHAPHR